MSADCSMCWDPYRRQSRNPPVAFWPDSTARSLQSSRLSPRNTQMRRSLDGLKLLGLKYSFSLKETGSCQVTIPPMFSLADYPRPWLTSLILQKWISTPLDGRSHREIMGPGRRLLNRLTSFFMNASGTPGNSSEDSSG